MIVTGLKPVSLRMTGTKYTVLRCESDDLDIRFAPSSHPNNEKEGGIQELKL